jgi:hypothetical protein
VSFAAITLCVAFQRVFIIVVYFVIDSVQKLLDTALYSAYNYKYLSFYIPSYLSASGRIEFSPFFKIH